MTYNPDIHHRQSIRLRGYDYSQPGYYFVTICAERMENIFGRIINNIFIPNKTGEFVLGEIWRIAHQTEFENIRLDEWQLMPNHLHLIIQIISQNNEQENNETPTLGRIIGGFKSRCFHELYKYITANDLPVRAKIWQRNYYDRIIRSEDALNRVRHYIRMNPYKWQRDWENLKFRQEISNTQRCKFSNEHYDRLCE